MSTPLDWCQVQQPPGWLCTRAPGHDGPCASRQVMRSGSFDMTIEDVELCDASTSWWVQLGDSREAHEVQCLKGKGHEGPHAGAVSWAA